MGLPRIPSLTASRGGLSDGLPRRAYYKIWNEYFRDETLQTELDITAYGTQHNILNAAWRKDYFTSALPWTQRGSAPALPVFGSASVDFDLPFANWVGPGDSAAWPSLSRASTQTSAKIVGMETGGPASSNVDGTNTTTYLKPNWDNFLSDNNTVDGSAFTSVDISDFRLTLAMQVWMERNARGGARYNEVIRVHWGVAPNDARLQRPEFIGGTKIMRLFLRYFRHPQRAPQEQLHRKGTLRATALPSNPHALENIASKNLASSWA